MRKYSWLFIIFVFCLSCNKKSKTNNENKHIDTIYYKSGSIKSIIHYKGSLMDGPFISFYENGNIEIEGTYQNDKPIDIGKIYYKDGTTKKILHFQDGKVNGLTKAYLKNDRINWGFNINNKVVYNFVTKDGKVIHKVDNLFFDQVRKCGEEKVCGRFGLRASNLDSTIIYIGELDKSFNLIDTVDIITPENMFDTISINTTDGVFSGVVKEVDISSNKFVLKPFYYNIKIDKSQFLIKRDENISIIDKLVQYSQFDKTD